MVGDDADCDYLIITQNATSIKRKNTRGKEMTPCKKCKAHIHFILSAKVNPVTKRRKPIPCNPGERVIVTPKGEVVRGYVPHHAT